jgi:hypothetical protein
MPHRLDPDLKLRYKLYLRFLLAYQYLRRGFFVFCAKLNLIPPTRKYYWVGDQGSSIFLHPRDLVLPVTLTQILIFITASHMPPTSALVFGSVGNFLVVALAIIPAARRRDHSSEFRN